MKLGERGEALIKGFETLRLKSYDDGLGNWTIGYGHTRGVRQGMKITMEAAQRFFREDVEPLEKAVTSLDLNLTQSQFDAIISLCFNVRQGIGAISGHSTIGNALRQGGITGIINAWRGFSLWTNTPGVELGLARRRTAEMALFLEDGVPGMV